MPELLYGWANKEIQSLQLPIIVEMWKKVMETGSGKRKLHATFTSEEIEKIHLLYKKTLVMNFKAFGGNGTPERHIMPIHDFEFAKRVVYFFATFD